MRDYARDWIASAMSFVRGHGGNSSSNAPVGAAFVIGALIVAVLGLRWISAAGGSEDGTDDTPWDYSEAGSVDTPTTIPASTPAKVVPIPDPDAGDQASADEEGATTTTTRPGIFLPGYSPTPGGGQGPSTTIGPTPTTTPGGGTTVPPTTEPPPPTTEPPPPTTEPPPPTTEPPPPTTEPPPPTTEPPPPTESVELSDVAQYRINRQFDELGWPFS